MKQALIATILSGSLAALTGCMSVAPKAEPTLTTTKHKPTPIRTRSKIVKHKKIVKPAEAPVPVVVPPLGGSGGSGGSGGTGTGGGSGGWG